MARKKAAREARDYRHRQEEAGALMRPEAGAQENFPAGKRKPPARYRYDSSLSPELCWDEEKARGEGEEYIREILGAENLQAAKDAARKLANISAQFLNWAGKAETGEISVPSLPLFVHERLSAKAVLDTLERKKRDRQKTLDLFNESRAGIGEKIRGAYEHKNGWQNRMILGDSLQAMNSLLRYESMGGEARMIYMDPPYGVKFGGNFQPFVRRRDVKDGEDESISREPEMVKAYRDTWTLGVHSWLTYMRDRLLLARDLLANDGSCFVQISDENVHFVRCIMDEVFGRENFVSVIYYATTSGFLSKTISRTGDYLVWYAKNIEHIKYKTLFKPKTANPADTAYRFVELKDGTRRPLTADERCGSAPLPENGKIYCYSDTQAMGAAGKDTPFKFEGETYRPKDNSHWKANYPGGMERLKENKRLARAGNKLRYIRYANDFSFQQITNNWDDTGIAGFASDKIYVVQTNEKVIQRCMLMTTDPGDLVIDPTCGSGTTAFVAEQWGRRWITMDVSRVPLALARQRLLTATYPYYRLRDEKTGPASGFVYERKQNKKGEETGGIVPHITLKSVAKNELPEEEVLTDKPEAEAGASRITGPFCVEAVMPVALAPGEVGEEGYGGEDKSGHIERMTEILRLSPVLRLPENKTMKLANVRRCGKSLNLHAEAENEKGELLAVVFGPPNSAVSERTVVEAGKEAARKDYSQLLIVAFAVEAAARETAEKGEETFGVRAVYVQASTDLAMRDLLKNMRTSEVFSVCGLPDVRLLRLREKSEEGESLYQARLLGLDVFDPVDMTARAAGGDEVPCWMLDTDYDGQCFRAGQVFFPKTGAWEKIKRAVRAEFDDSVWERLAGDTSEPFVPGPGGKIAVKAIDERGNELLVVKSLEEAEEEE